mmetsp:Transcript_1154/g.3818  ORF Transcript_1154/g.3818 Transcript_1154/m.3818 type:complete len:94 (+) Transcript_1154:937-1218(+)
MGASPVLSRPSRAWPPMATCRVPDDVSIQELVRCIVCVRRARRGAECAGAELHQTGSQGHLAALAVATSTRARDPPGEQDEREEDQGGAAHSL